MKTQAPQYSQLKGSGRKSSGFVSLQGTTYRLLLGDDHLLQVESERGFSEQYRRFYFRDIQAIVLRKNSRFAIGNIILGTFFTLFWASSIAIFLSSNANPSWSRLLNDPGQFIGVIFFGGLGVLIAIFWLVHVVRGGTCICHIQTAVQTEELPSLFRVARAQRVLEQLRPLIQQAQAQIEPHAAQQSPPATTMESPTVPSPDPGVDA